MGGAGVAALLRRHDGRLTPAGRTAACLLAVAVLTVVLAWTASQLSPAWANRYLAIAVAPLLLTAAGGLAHAGRLGIVALVGGRRAGRRRHRAGRQEQRARGRPRRSPRACAPGDIVVATQPEQVSVLAYYLPEGVRFATLTGALRDTGVTDWRDGPERLGATSAERDLQPLLDELEPGQRLVLVEPIVFDVRRWHAPWTSLVRMRSDEWRQHISNDSRFSVSAVEPALPIERRPNAVQATVYVKTHE